MNTSDFARLYNTVESSAVDNANDTAREEGFAGLPSDWAGWSACLIESAAIVMDDMGVDAATQRKILRQLRAGR